MVYLIPTIDVEAIRSLRRLGSYDMLIAGKVNKSYWGVRKIIEIVRAYQGDATFFVDVCEMGHSKKKMVALCREIIQHGCDVQLHIHPQFMFDVNRPLLNHYSFEEQIHIIKQCTDVFYELTDHYPIAHRAGGYGVNEDTFQALAACHIPVDASFLYGDRRCKLDNQILPRNAVGTYQGIIEIPVTVFRNDIGYKLFGCTLLEHKRITRLDIDTCSLVELQRVYDRLRGSGVQFIVLFLHSKSLINFSWDYKIAYPNYANVRKFERFLAYAHAEGAQMGSLRKFYEAKLVANKYVESKMGTIPSIQTERSLVSSVRKTVQSRFREYSRGPEHWPFFSKR